MEPEKSQVAIWRRVSCWISNAISAQTHTRARARTPTRTRTHPRAHTHAHIHKCVMLITLPRQLWFHQRASLLRYMYIACLLITEAMYVYCAVRNESLHKIYLNLASHFEGPCLRGGKVFLRVFPCQYATSTQYPSSY